MSIQFGGGKGLLRPFNLVAARDFLCPFNLVVTLAEYVPAARWIQVYL